MSPEVISLVLLALMFLIATWRNVNMGFLGFVAAFYLGAVVLGQASDEFLAGFPVDLFITLVGLTYLFGFAQNNGAIDVLVTWCMKLLRGNVQLAPWMFFFLTAGLMALGALFAVAIVTPLALTFARRHAINQFMMGLLVVHGALAGAFSPISVYGIFINDYLTSRGLEATPVMLFTAPLLFNTVFALVVWLVLRMRPDLRADGDANVAIPGPRQSLDKTRTAGVPVKARLESFQILTLCGLAAMAISVLMFGLDVGLVSITIACVLAFVNPQAGKAALSKVSWSVVVLIAGVLTFIEVLQSAGTVDWVSAGIATIGIPLLSALLLFYLAGFVSALASSLGVIGVVIALAVPFLESGDVHIGGFMAALAIAATIVDISPFSTNGAMLLANVDSSIRDKYYTQMIGYAGLMCLIGPGLAWLMVAIPTWVTIG